jgi:hypothetical protein
MRRIGNWVENMLGRKPQPEAPRPVESVVRCYVEGPEEVYRQLTESGRVDTTFIFDLSVDSRDAQAYSAVLRKISETTQEDVLLQLVNQASISGEIQIGNVPIHRAQARLKVDWDEFLVGILKVRQTFPSLDPLPHLQR